MVKYKFKEPAIFKEADKADPQQIGEELSRIAEANDGKLTPHATVEAAKNRRSVLHRHFEWNDEKCGERFSLGPSTGADSLCCYRGAGR